MKRIVLAVFVGYLANVLLIASAEQLLVRVFSDAKYFVADVVTQCLIQVSCGYLCTRISNTRVAVVSLITIGLLVGTFSLALSWHVDPHWYAIVLLVVYPPCVWIGYRIAIGHRSVAPGA
jgi:hypothetical protein